MNQAVMDSSFSIHSDEATVVRGRVTCWSCSADIGVICLYCQTGFVHGEAMLNFSVANISNIDESLRLQLGRWPSFRPVRRAGTASVRFANHCPWCEAVQDDFRLHFQPGGIFFSFQGTRAAELEIHALKGNVRLSGDEGFDL